MPFAKKFRAMMDFPFPGDDVGGFTVESVEVGHEGEGTGRYTYAVRMVLCGAGGVAGVRRATKALFAQHPFTFSGYGTPYQMWFGRPEIENLGDQRYLVTVDGAGSRMWLEDELERFLGYVASRGLLSDEADMSAPRALVDEYVNEYRAEVARLVGRYRSKLRRHGENVR